MALFIPAMDLVQGEVVRLYQGKIEQKKVYFKKVTEALDLFLKHAVKYVHIVDLDGAIADKPQKEVFTSIVRHLKGKYSFQWAGGIRTQEYLGYVLTNGAEKVVLSTQAFLDKAFVRKALKDFPGKIIISFDFRGKALCVKGWKEEIPEKDIPGIFKEFMGFGCREFVITDISSDGTLAGARLDFFKAVMKGIPASFYIAGGISSEDDLRSISKASLPSLKGVVVGKALYEGKINIETAQKLLDGV